MLSSMLMLCFAMLCYAMSGAQRRCGAWRRGGRGEDGPGVDARDAAARLPTLRRRPIDTTGRRGLGQGTCNTSCSGPGHVRTIGLCNVHRRWRAQRARARQYRARSQLPLPIVRRALLRLRRRRGGRRARHDVAALILCSFDSPRLVQRLCMPCGSQYTVTRRYTFVHLYAVCRTSSAVRATCFTVDGYRARCFPLGPPRLDSWILPHARPPDLSWRPVNN